MDYNLQKQIIIKYFITLYGVVFIPAYTVIQILLMFDPLVAFVEKYLPSLLFIKSNIITFIVLGLILFCIVYATINHIISLGTKGVGCSFSRFLSYYFKRKYVKTLYYFHTEIYHLVYNTIKEFKNENFQDINNSHAKKSVEIFTQKMSEIIEKLTGVEFSITIKLFEEFEPNPHIIVAKNYILIPSKEEVEKRFNRDENSHLITGHKKNQIEGLYEFIKQNIDTDERKFSRNYAYDYVVSDTQHYWMSNDLKVQQQKKEFICSNHERMHCKSIAVFLISAPLNFSHNESQRLDKATKAVGLLIFDSPRTNVFIEKETKLLMGLMAHYLYEIINEIYNKIDETNKVK